MIIINIQRLIGHTISKITYSLKNHEMFFVLENGLELMMKMRDDRICTRNRFPVDVSTIENIKIIDIGYGGYEYINYIFIIDANKDIYRFYGYDKIYKTFFPLLLYQLYVYDILEEDGLCAWKEHTEESISDTSSSGSSAGEIEIQIKQYVTSLTATQKLFEWFETAESASESE